MSIIVRASESRGLFVATWISPQSARRVEKISFVGICKRSAVS